MVVARDLYGRDDSSAYSTHSYTQSVHTGCCLELQGFLKAYF